MRAILSIIKTPFIVFLSLLLYKIFNILNLDICNLIPIEYEIEFNVLVYSCIFEMIFRAVQYFISKNKVHIGCIFFKDKTDLTNENINDMVICKVNSNYNQIFFRVKYEGYYRKIKNYKLMLKFPYWIDINEPNTNMYGFKFEEKEIEEGRYITNIIMDLSKIDIEDDKLIDGSKDIKLEFLLNDIESTGSKDFVDIKLQKKKRELNLLCKFNSNRLHLYKDIN